MDRNRIRSEYLARINTPCYLIDEQALKNNLKILKDVQDRAGCKILLALKAFALTATFPLIRRYLSGVCASSPYEARLGCEEFKGEVHTYAPAYSEQDIQDLNHTTDYLIFNSENQLNRFKSVVSSKIELGLRINPEYSEIDISLYDPCASGSRLGIPLNAFPTNLEGVTGRHFHAFCEQNSDTLGRILEVVEKKFGHILHTMKWVNFGGGHHITRPDYDIDLLVATIRRFKDKYQVDVILEPGEAIALNCGVLITSVLDIIENDGQIAILDTSAENHMPDVLAIPYRPDVWNATPAGESAYTYRLAGVTCLAGDIIGDYSFPTPLAIGDKLIFNDMAHYTMVKNTTFNGVKLPSINLLHQDNSIDLARLFSYLDYKNKC